MLTRRIAVLTATMIVLAACSGTSSGTGGRTDHRWTVDTIADTVRIRTESGGAWGGTATLVPEMRIGVFDGEDPYVVGDVSAIAVTEAGELYLMDRHVPALRKYDPEGRHLYDLGREGGGPGEYKSPDGGLAVVDRCAGAKISSSGF